MPRPLEQGDHLATTTAAQPATERYTPKHLLATVMHWLLDIPELRLKPGLGRVGTILTEGEPIPGLL